MVANNIDVFKIIAFYLAFSINVIIMFTLKNNPTNEPYPYISPSENLIDILGYILTILSLIIVAYFLFKTAPIYVNRVWSEKGITLNPIVLVKRIIWTCIVVF